MKKRRKGIPTARRSRDYERKQGNIAEIVERTWHMMRHDLFGVFDVLVIKNNRIVGVQAYLSSKANRISHAKTFADHAGFLAKWRAAGGGCEFQIWQRGSNGRWTVTTEEA